MERDAQLTVGMATFDDFDGVYFTVQSLRLHHAEVLDRLQFVVVDNHPGGEHGRAVERFLKQIPAARYVPFEQRVSTAIRNEVFRAAATPYVLCLDCHVLLAPGSLTRLLNFFAQHPACDDLLQGPLLHEGLHPQRISTHMDPRWDKQMFGTWGTDPRGLDPHAMPFEIPMHGLGLFACRRQAWLGFSDRFRGFGGEEGYIHEKFRQAGRRTLCLPFLRWLHRFIRPAIDAYPLRLHDRVHNYLVGWLELGLDPKPILDHFAQWGGRERWEAMLVELQSEQALRRVA